MSEKRKDTVPKGRAPTFYAIIATKLLKGALFLTLAVIAYTLSDNNLPVEYQKLLHWLRVNPERKFFTELASQVAKITEANVLWVGAGSFLYSLFSLVEGIGLIFRVSWCGWMAIGESAFFIPLEVYELMTDFRMNVFVLFVINVVILWYLLKNRHRLFRHHHH
jgi:uncharacterized membrane protein (DUF2068 family)